MAAISSSPAADPVAHAPAGAPPAAVPLGPDPADLLWVGVRPVDRRGRVVVEVVGEVDSSTAPLLESCLRGQAGRPGVRTLVVDLSRVGHLSCAGLAVLAEAAGRCAGRGARLVVRPGDRRVVHRALRLVGSPLVVEPPATAGPGGRLPTGGRGGRPRRGPAVGGAAPPGTAAAPRSGRPRR
jgi:anti-anti-sigma factor